MPLLLKSNVLCLPSIQNFANPMKLVQIPVTRAQIRDQPSVVRIWQIHCLIRTKGWLGTRDSFEREGYFTSHMQVFYTPIVHQRRDKKKTHKWNVNHHTHTGWTVNEVKKSLVNTCAPLGYRWGSEAIIVKVQLDRQNGYCLWPTMIYSRIYDHT